MKHTHTGYSTHAGFYEGRGGLKRHTLGFEQGSAGIPRTGTAALLTSLFLSCPQRPTRVCFCRTPAMTGGSTVRCCALFFIPNQTPAGPLGKAEPAYSCFPVLLAPSHFLAGGGGRRGDTRNTTRLLASLEEGEGCMGMKENLR